jgi:Ser/Thr protein kinase RdoA (MazF antagonist)
VGLARRAELPFVPAVIPTTHGATWAERAGRLWDLTRWLPGQADFHAQPTVARLEAACVALARLHIAWAGVCPQVGPCPGIQCRLERTREWMVLVPSGWQPPLDRTREDPVHSWAERAWRLLRRWMDHVPRVLSVWAERPLPLQPCLCDIWHDHVLFDGDTIAGLIDYGGVKIDHVAVDLARLLGSMVGDRKDLRAAGLHAYSRWRRLSWEEEALVSILDETGTLIGMANWLKWLYREGRYFEDRAAVARRLAELVERVEGWNAVVGRGVAWPTK